MKPTSILIIGGYGNTGSYIADLLLQHDNLEIVIAGRNAEKAFQKAKQLQKTYKKEVKSRRLDIADVVECRRAFQECDLVVVAAASTEHVEATITSAIESNTDYIDTHLSFPEKISILKKYEKIYHNKNMTVITDAGFHPGLPAALVRFVNLHFDTLQIANISSYMGIQWKNIKTSFNTVEEFMEELKNFNPTVFRNKKWEKISFKELGGNVFDFGEPIGKKNCIPMFLHELETLPKKIPSLEETGFYVSGFNPFTDNIITPLVMIALSMNVKWISRNVGRLFFWSAAKFARPPYVTMLQLEAKGIKKDKETSIQIQLSHEDPYLFTAIPVVTCILQYLERNHTPGFYFQSHFLRLEKLLQNLEGLDIRVIEKI